MRALILVDIQNDFMPSGALPVEGGDAVVPVANRLLPLFDIVAATQDWHPENHGSFAANHPGKKPGDVIELGGVEQILWPTHCVQETPGAAFHPALLIDRVDRVFPKGTDPEIDSYSGFFDNGQRRATGLGDHLLESEKGVSEVFVLGLATDYCVKFTALDARRLGFRTTVVEDGCRGVDLRPGDVKRAIEEMRDAGVQMAQSADLEIASRRRGRRE
ncbi:MAG: bifunctional nicotinamidase/pyrazinamidase [Planctomycetota bacterium]|nr:bifunctional nicotinamidase/pyrazinamidase [Planctomycetota bacterium]